MSWIFTKINHWHSTLHPLRLHQHISEGHNLQPESSWRNLFYFGKRCILSCLCWDFYSCITPHDEPGADTDKLELILTQETWEWDVATQLQMSLVIWCRYGHVGLNYQKTWTKQSENQVQCAGVTNHTWSALCPRCVQLCVHAQPLDSDHQR